MNYFEQLLTEYLDDDEPGFLNQYRVEICMHDDDCFSVAGPVPGFKKEDSYSASLFFEVDNVASLIELLALKHLNDLDNVTPDMMLRLYETGNASISLIFNTYDCFSMSFKKMGDVVFAIDDTLGEGVHYAINKRLETQDDFYHYANDYYQQHYQS